MNEWLQSRSGDMNTKAPPAHYTCGLISRRSHQLQDDETLRRVYQFSFSVDLFERNHAELRLFLAYLSSAEISLQIASPEHKWRQKEAMGEVQCLLHNFVASALSLVDHTRVFYNNLYAPRGLIPDYQAEIDSRFVSHPLSQFLKGLRQMAQHYRLPSITMTRRFERSVGGNTFTTVLTLNKPDLKTFSSWTAPAKVYLGAAPDAIEIAPICDGYAQHVAEFYQWFAKKQDQIHGAAAKIWSHIITHGITFPERDVIAAIDRHVADLEKQAKESLTFESVRDALSPALTLLDQRQLMYCIYDPGLWRDHALARIRKRFTIPLPLSARIHALFERDV